MSWVRRLRCRLHTWVAEMIGLQSRASGIPHRHRAMELRVRFELAPHSPGTTPRPFTPRAKGGQTTTAYRSSWRGDSPMVFNFWLITPGPKPLEPEVADCLVWKTGPGASQCGRT